VDDESRLGRELIAGGARYHAHFVPDEDATANFYLQACARLDSAGIAQYEISNFARPGMQSRHNLKYWTRQPYIGFGLDAHSMLEASPDPYDTLGAGAATVSDGGGCSPCAVASADLDAVRFSTPDSLDNFMAGAPLHRTPVPGRAALEEAFFLGLRLNRGVSLKQIGARFAINVETAFGEIIRELESYGVLERDQDTLRLTPAGRLVSNEVFERFIALPAYT
jgi:oxygen-independent coproporphyrinogen-3 oxidase